MKTTIRISGFDVFLRQGRYAFELLLEKRLWLFLGADALLILNGLFRVLLETGNPFVEMVLVPTLLLGLPALSGVVALERRAGSLDLALAVPSTERYFVRRLIPVCGFFILQGILSRVRNFTLPGWAGMD